jgi:hypothetical protein
VRRLILVVLAACRAPAAVIDAAPDAHESDARPPARHALVPVELGTDFEPMTLAATAPRGARLELRLDVYHHHVRDPQPAARVEYWFEHDGTVPVTILFTWSLEDRLRIYTLDVDGQRTAGIVTNPRHGAAVYDRGNGFTVGADPAAVDVDYPIFEWLSDPNGAGGYRVLADGIAKHDFGVVISARFLPPARR